MKATGFIPTKVWEPTETRGAGTTGLIGHSGRKLKVLGYKVIPRAFIRTRTTGFRGRAPVDDDGGNVATVPRRKVGESSPGILFGRHEPMTSDSIGQVV